MEHRFQINLTGLIDLLSKHLYTRPDVFMRELLQNAHDAITARANLQPGHEGKIGLSLDDEMRTLIISDNGIGLSEEEMHRFLAVIGESSKRGNLFGETKDFIGQFGIGLLACFIVADQIELTSRSAQNPDAPLLRWRGRPDGSYDIEMLDEEHAPGTTVKLIAKHDALPLFQAETLFAAAANYGGILPWPIQFSHQGQHKRVNLSEDTHAFPWDASHLPEAIRPAFWLEFAQQNLQADMFDAIPLHSAAGGVDGIAYVLKRTPGHTGKSRHKVYLKRMLLSENVENLLPPWAFFVQCVVNCSNLRPTAARNAFYQDELLQMTQNELGACLRQYLLRLARHEPARLDSLMSYHHLTLKALALEDDEFFKLFIPWFPLETNYGQSTLGTYLKRNQRILCTTDVDEFRQIAHIAAAQNIDIINGGYVYDTDLLQRYGELFPLTPVRFIKPADIGHQLQSLSLEQEAQYQKFLQSAQEILSPFECHVKLKVFEPADLPTLLVVNRNARLHRRITQTAEKADDLWRGVLTQIKPEQEYRSELCFNFAHTLIRSLIQHPDAVLVQQIVQILYVQALLMGHHPLSSQELALMSQGLSGLLAWRLLETGNTTGVTTWH